MAPAIARWSLAESLTASTATLAGNVGCPNPDHGCDEVGTPGCSDAACCLTVCGDDPACCELAWDGPCVEVASLKCPRRDRGDRCATCCPTDLNRDGMVGGADLGVLLAAWNSGDPCADLDGDGLVVGADIGILLGSWGECVYGPGCACPAANHDCLTPGGKGCADSECCDAVCAIDPFCCQSSWDLACVERASSICLTTKCLVECPQGSVPESEQCGEDTDGGCPTLNFMSDCCLEHREPGCDDPACTALV